MVVQEAFTTGDGVELTEGLWGVIDAHDDGGWRIDFPEYGGVFWVCDEQMNCLVADGAPNPEVDDCDDGEAPEAGVDAALTLSEGVNTFEVAHDASEKRHGS